MTIKEIQEEIISDFSMFNDWEERYEYIIDLGKSLQLIDEKHKTEQNLIKGCQSKVWLYSTLENGKINYFADSDAILTKGIIALLLSVYSGKTPQEIIADDMSFIEKIGLKEHLSPTRANGLVSMLKQIKMYAIALSTKL